MKKGRGVSPSSHHEPAPHQRPLSSSPSAGTMIAPSAASPEVGETATAKPAPTTVCHDVDPSPSPETTATADALFLLCRVANQPAEGNGYTITKARVQVLRHALTSHKSKS
nr:hypothetical protein Iba_chr05cCG12120 [Ipomoea batatas]